MSNMLYKGNISFYDETQHYLLPITYYNKNILLMYLNINGGKQL